METDKELHQRAETGDMAAQWEIARQLDRATQKGTRSMRTDNGLVKLPLKLPREWRSGRRILPQIPRCMDLVEKELVEIFFDLVSGKRPWPLFLHGPVGAGKSRAVLCLCDYVARARYVTLRELCDRKMRPEDFQAWDWQAPALLVVDEIGTRLKPGDLDYTCLVEAWEEREEKSLGVAVYVSNLAPAELNAYFDNRIASRLLCGTVFKLDGDDRRMRREHGGEAQTLPVEPAEAYA